MEFKTTIEKREEDKKNQKVEEISEMIKGG